MMANWNGNQLLRQIASYQTGSSREQQGFTTFLYDYDFSSDYLHHHHHHHPFSGSADDEHEQLMMMKSSSSRPTAENKPLLAVGMSAANKNSTTSTNSSNNNYQQEMMTTMIMRKRRLRTDQIDALEMSFREEVKLEPERKMKLSRELGLHPRQVAVWFQNRRARWKAKQLERLYNALKQEFDIVSKEKQNLHQEVMILKAKLEDVTSTQGSTGYTEVVSKEETVESTSIAIQSSNGGIQGTSCDHQVAGGSHFFTIDGYNINSDSLPYWDVAPGCT